MTTLQRINRKLAEARAPTLTAVMSGEMRHDVTVAAVKWGISDGGNAE
jgi:hypothetical protein